MPKGLADYKAKSKLLSNLTCLSEKCGVAPLKIKWGTSFYSRGDFPAVSVNQKSPLHLGYTIHIAAFPGGCFQILLGAERVGGGCLSTDRPGQEPCELD